MVESYPINLAGCGVLTILKEAGRLLSNYIRLLHPFIFTFLLPVALLHVVEVIAISRISSHWVLHQFGGSAIHRWMPHPHHHHQHFGFFVSGTSPKWLPKFRQSGEEDSPYRPQIMSVEN
ncbi:uncharacterized protein [Physcomitrium patens]|uniref:uncharacterized protein n=1 Tax=Physcomitrium patens TaxID=3218 RepID=UPI003CCE4D0D